MNNTYILYIYMYYSYKYKDLFVHLLNYNILYYDISNITLLISVCYNLQLY